MSAVDDVRKICMDRLASMGRETDVAYTQRLDREIADLASWERYKGENKAAWILSQIGCEGYPVNTNKSNSLVLFLTGLSSVDPVALGKECVVTTLVSGDCPDIDTDFDPRIRDWVKQHIVDTFGADNVCSIGTYQTYRTRAVILDVARALGLDVGEANNVTKRIDPLKSFEDDEGEETKVDEMSFDEICEHYPELRDYFAIHPEVRHHAEILRNQIKNMGKHAGGVIISDKSLKDRIPVLWDKAANEDRQVISAWAESGNSAELSAVGLVKYDILGLNNLPVISGCIDLIAQTTGIRLKRKDIPIDDHEAIYKCSDGDLVGIFQLENPSTREVIQKVGMNSLNDVAAVTSLIRPGPRDMGMDIEYAERKHGKKYDMPEFLKTLLADTYGVLTYQEQAMKISQVLSGFTGPESNKLRKAIGKKLTDLMAEMKAKFIKGAKPRIDAGEITEMEVEQVWNLIESFAGYGFNRSHAICYSAISTVELWLKYHYPVEYITSLINNTELGKKKHGSEDIMVDYVNYARRRGITVLPPDINKSRENFTIENGAIRYSLGHIKNVASAASMIVSFQPFASVEDFHERVKIETEGKDGKKTARRPNKRVVESLIAAGAFDAFGTRNEVMAEYYRVRKGKEEVPQYTDEKWVELEKEMIGLCLSQPPLYKQYEDLIRQKGWCMIADVPSEKRKRIKVFGKIENIRPHVSKNGNSMYIVTITDGLDTMNFMVFQGGQQLFRDNFKQGYVGAIPLSKFDEGDSRFFDDRGEIEVLSR